MDFRAATPYRNTVLCKERANCTHQLASGLILEKLGPRQGPPFVEALDSGRQLSRRLAGQGLGLFLAAGNLNEHESVVLRFSPHFILWKEKEVGMVDLVQLADVKPKAREVPRGGKIDLPKGLLL